MIKTKWFKNKLPAIILAVASLLTASLLYSASSYAVVCQQSTGQCHVGGGSKVTVIQNKSGSSSQKSSSSSSGQSNGSGSEDPAIKCTNGQCDLIKKYVTPAITVLGAIFGTVAAISIIIGGINFSTSEGDPQKASRAKARITNTVIAVVAFIFLYAFLQFLIPGGLFNR